MQHSQTNLYNAEYCVHGEEQTASSYKMYINFRLPRVKWWRPSIGIAHTASKSHEMSLMYRLNSYR